jgi:carbon storage regulator
MLVVSRRPGERILVSSCGLAVAILSVDGKRFRLGISAPVEMRVYREEVWAQICASAHGSPAYEQEP